MDKGLKVGRLFGINIKIDWSWLLIFFLVTWNLVSVFGQIHSAWSFGLQVGIALLASILFFLSVLAHELAHSLVAKAQGMNVRSITLFLFGGVSNIQRNPDSPLNEFLMAAVGPITSLVLGVIFIFLASTGIRSIDISNLTNLAAGLSPQATILLWLGPINIILGIFNLIPGFPLDGGRILRSIFWGITNNLKKATRWASYIGQGIAWLMIVAGISMIFGIQIPFFGSGFINGIWLAFIGWFLNSAAVNSYQQILVQDILEGVTVQQMMRVDAPVVEPDCSVSALVHDHIMQTDDHAFPVIQYERLVGLVTLEDVRKVPRDQWEQVPVQRIMTSADQLETVNPDDDAEEALKKLRNKDVRQLPVLRGDSLVGVLRRRDIIKWLRLQSDKSVD